MKINCILGKHKDRHIYHISQSLQDVFQCEKCGKYYVFHKGINCGYRTKQLPLLGGVIQVPNTGIGDLSDGYHTFNELYHHRAILFSIICNQNKDISWKSQQHHDGTMYSGMFIVGINTPQGQATYHYDIKPYWNIFNVKELEIAPEWDGHTPSIALDRLHSILPQHPADTYHNSQLHNEYENKQPYGEE